MKERKIDRKKRRGITQNKQTMTEDNYKIFVKNDKEKRKIKKSKLS